MTGGLKESLRFGFGGLVVLRKRMNECQHLMRSTWQAIGAPQQTPGKKSAALTKKLLRSLMAMKARNERRLRSLNDWGPVPRLKSCGRHCVQLAPKVFDVDHGRPHITGEKFNPTPTVVR